MVASLVSPYFLLYVAAGGACILKVDKISSRVWHHILSFLYSGKTQIPHSDMLEVLKAAQVLQIKYLGQVKNRDLWDVKSDVSVSQTPQSSLNSELNPRINSRSVPRADSTTVADASLLPSIGAFHDDEDFVKRYAGYMQDSDFGDIGSSDYAESYQGHHSLSDENSSYAYSHTMATAQDFAKSFPYLHHMPGSGHRSNIHSVDQQQAPRCEKISQMLSDINIASDPNNNEVKERGDDNSTGSVLARAMATIPEFGAMETTPTSLLPQRITDNQREVSSIEMSQNSVSTSDTHVASLHSMHNQNTLLTRPHSSQITSTASNSVSLSSRTSTCGRTQTSVVEDTQASSKQVHSVSENIHKGIVPKPSVGNSVHSETSTPEVMDTTPLACPLSKESQTYDLGARSTVSLICPASTAEASVVHSLLSSSERKDTKTQAYRVSLSENNAAHGQNVTSKDKSTALQDCQISKAWGESNTGQCQSDTVGDVSKSQIVPVTSTASSDSHHQISTVSEEVEPIPASSASVEVHKSKETSSAVLKSSSSTPKHVDTVAPSLRESAFDRSARYSAADDNSLSPDFNEVVRKLSSQQDSGYDSITTDKGQVEIENKEAFFLDADSHVPVPVEEAEVIETYTASQQRMSVETYLSVKDSVSQPSVEGKPMGNAKHRSRENALEREGYTNVQFPKLPTTEELSTSTVQIETLHVSNLKPEGATQISSVSVGKSPTQFACVSSVHRETNITSFPEDAPSVGATQVSKTLLGNNTNANVTSDTKRDEPLQKTLELLTSRSWSSDFTALMRAHVADLNTGQQSTGLKAKVDHHHSITKMMMAECVNKDVKSGALKKPVGIDNASANITSNQQRTESDFQVDTRSRTPKSTMAGTVKQDAIPESRAQPSVKQTCGTDEAAIETNKDANETDNARRTLITTSSHEICTVLKVDGNDKSHKKKKKHKKAEKLHKKNAKNNGINFEATLHNVLAQLGQNGAPYEKKEQCQKEATHEQKEQCQKEATHEQKEQCQKEATHEQKGARNERKEKCQNEAADETKRMRQKPAMDETQEKHQKGMTDQEKEKCQKGMIDQRKEKCDVNVLRNSSEKKVEADNVKNIIGVKPDVHVQKSQSEFKSTEAVPIPDKDIYSEAYNAKEAVFSISKELMSPKPLDTAGNCSSGPNVMPFKKRTEFTRNQQCVSQFIQLPEVSTQKQENVLDLTRRNTSEVSIPEQQNGPDFIHQKSLGASQIEQSASGFKSHTNSAFTTVQPQTTESISVPHSSSQMTSQQERPVDFAQESTAAYQPCGIKVLACPEASVAVQHLSPQKEPYLFADMPHSEQNKDLEQCEVENYLSILVGGTKSQSHVNRMECGSNEVDSGSHEVSKVESADASSFSRGARPKSENNKSETDVKQQRQVTLETEQNSEELEASQNFKDTQNEDKILNHHASCSSNGDYSTTATGLTYQMGLENEGGEATVHTCTSEETQTYDTITSTENLTASFVGIPSAKSQGSKISNGVNSQSAVDLSEPPNLMAYAPDADGTVLSTASTSASQPPPSLSVSPHTAMQNPESAKINEVIQAMPSESDIQSVAQGRSTKVIDALVMPENGEIQTEQVKVTNNSKRMLTQSSAQVENTKVADEMTDQRELQHEQVKLAFSSARMSTQSSSHVENTQVTDEIAGQTNLQREQVKVAHSFTRMPVQPSAQVENTNNNEVTTEKSNLEQLQMAHSFERMPVQSSTQGENANTTEVLPVQSCADVQSEQAKVAHGSARASTQDHQQPSSILPYLNVQTSDFHEPKPSGVRQNMTEYTLLREMQHSQHQGRGTTDEFIQQEIAHHRPSAGVDPSASGTYSSSAVSHIAQDLAAHGAYSSASQYYSYQAPMNQDQHMQFSYDHGHQPIGPMISTTESANVPVQIPIYQEIGAPAEMFDTRAPSVQQYVELQYTGAPHPQVLDYHSTHEYQTIPEYHNEQEYQTIQVQDYHGNQLQDYSQYPQQVQYPPEAYQNVSLATSDVDNWLAASIATPGGNVVQVENSTYPMESSSVWDDDPIVPVPKRQALKAPNPRQIPSNPSNFALTTNAQNNIIDRRCSKPKKRSKVTEIVSPPLQEEQCLQAVKAIMSRPKVRELFDVETSEETDGEIIENKENSSRENSTARFNLQPSMINIESNDERSRSKEKKDGKRGRSRSKDGQKKQKSHSRERDAVVASQTSISKQLPTGQKLKIKLMPPKKSTQAITSQAVQVPGINRIKPKPQKKKESKKQKEQRLKMKRLQGFADEFKRYLEHKKQMAGFSEDLPSTTESERLSTSFDTLRGMNETPSTENQLLSTISENQVGNESDATETALQGDLAENHESVPENNSVLPSDRVSAVSMISPPVKRGRGRPRKYPLEPGKCTHVGINKGHGKGKVGRSRKSVPQIPKTSPTITKVTPLHRGLVGRPKKNIGQSEPKGITGMNAPESRLSRVPADSSLSEISSPEPRFGRITLRTKRRRPLLFASVTGDAK